MDDIHKDIEEYNQNEKRKMLIAFDDMSVDMLSDKNLNPVVTELFIRGKQLQVFSCFQHSILLWKFQTKERYNRMHLVIHQILTFKTLRTFIKNICKAISFLVIDTTLASDNSLRFRNNLLERIQKLIMAIDDKIKDEKLQYNINREAVKISALSSGKIAKYECLTGK